MNAADSPRMTLDAARSAEVIPAAPESLWRIAWRQLHHNRLAMICLAILSVYTVTWLYAEGVYWTAKIRGVVPGYKISHYEIRNELPSWAHPLGTNFAGRDNLQQLIQGTRIAFEIGLLTSVIVIPLGFVLGALAGYFGRKLDGVI